MSVILRFAQRFRREMLNRRSQRDRADAPLSKAERPLSKGRVSLHSSYSCAGAIVAAARPLGGQLPREVRPYTIPGVSFCA